MKKSFMHGHILMTGWLFVMLPLLIKGHADWMVQSLDAPKIFSDMSSRSIAIDKSTNTPHIVYGKDFLYHAYLTESGWQIETVDVSPGVGRYASIAIDSLGNVHISYYDATNGDLKYATNKLGPWTAIKIDTGNVGMFSSIAVDSNDRVHIAYYDLMYGDLKYATNMSGAWTVATGDPSGTAPSSHSMYSSIAVDKNNQRPYQLQRLQRIG